MGRTEGQTAKHNQQPDGITGLLDICKNQMGNKIKYYDDIFR